MQKDVSLPPKHPPPSSLRLFASLFQVTPATISSLWNLLRFEVWSSPKASTAASEAEVKAYNKVALDLGTCEFLSHSFRSLFDILRPSLLTSYPPTRVCMSKDCTAHRASDTTRTLTDPRTHKARLFTLREGALPIYTTSLYCRACHRRYHRSYSVQNVNISQHCFISSDLLEFSAVSKTQEVLSLTNCSRKYSRSIGLLNASVLNNLTAHMDTFQAYLSSKTNFHWQSSMQLLQTDVLNGFFLYSLLLDHAEQRSTRVLDHNAPSQKDRLQPVLQARNARMEGFGLEEYTHACNLCYIVFLDDEGNLVKIQAAACNGHTTGHPCCAVHGCKEPLLTLRQRFCATHTYLNNICAVTDCQLPIESRHLTCGSPDHRVLENAYFQQGKALSRLRKCLNNTPGHSQGKDS
ncbi:hypothetical protein CVT26_010631, partial [Gymnopilus dilepis]